MIPVEIRCPACDRPVLLAGSECAIWYVSGGPVDPNESPVVVFHQCRTVLFARSVNTAIVEALAREFFPVAA